MDKVEQVNCLLACIPPKLDEADSILSSEEFTKEELACIACEATEHCFCEYSDALDPQIPSITLDSMHSNYLLDVLRLLLDHGLDPNISVNEDNALWMTQYVDAPNVGAAAMRLLLENGGDPNLYIPPGPETLFEFIDFKVWEDDYDCDHVIQCWLVLMAYGGHWSNGEIPLMMLDGNKIDVFKRFEELDYRFSNGQMHIFRKKDRVEVARRARIEEQ